MAEWRRRLHTVIFEADTPGGRAFDLALLLAIVLSVAAVILESVPQVRLRHGPELRALEWFFTIVFTIEFVLRLVSVGRPLRYLFSFFGVVDFLSILPTYLALFIGGAQSLLVIRGLRLLRTFRVLKLVHFVSEAKMLRAAMIASARKIIVFLMAVLIIITIVGTAIYVVEGERGGFTSIPMGIYWALVTLTTVGYGDLTPVTPFGRLLASCVMVMGYGVIAVPTGIVSVELAGVWKKVSTQSCPQCAAEGHDPDAKHCKYCGTAL